ncbi:hypothetical protein Hdeb2414_s0016g00475811 [Helianthus debilis subsp. tardiflorus]
MKRCNFPQSSSCLTTATVGICVSIVMRYFGMTSVLSQRPLIDDLSTINVANMVGSNFLYPRNHLLR